MAMIDLIDEYYKAKGIHSLYFTCQHKQECSADCQSFTGPKSAFVPDKYSDSYPRIAFLSLDSGDSNTDPNERTPYAVRRQEQIDCIVEKKGLQKGLTKGQHWYETHYWTQKIHNAFPPNNISLEETKNYFCHLNSAKCCQNKPHSKEADSHLFRNCREYLPPELKLLSPHILITQGNRAHEAINDIFKFTDTLYKSVYLISSPEKFLWVRTCHPSSYGIYKKHKNDLPAILKVLRKNIFHVV